MQKNGHRCAAEEYWVYIRTLVVVQKNGGRCAIERS